jgi:dTDP-4-dehydrorhamnose reductase
MRVVILGVSGLIGHQLFRVLSEGFETYGILHKKKGFYGNIPLLSGKNVIDNIDVNDFKSLKEVLTEINPGLILNCIGITLRKNEINNLADAIRTNALFPHLLAQWAGNNGKRVIHFSTDCVFNGKTGNYNEDSLTTAENTYGRTKALGEIRYENSLTIRSSFIGQELFGRTELLEWFLAQKGKQIKGFRNTFYSGVSTIFMAMTMKDIISHYPGLSGLYNLAPEKPISKYDLLCLARDAYKIDVDIVPEDQHVHFPTLDASKLRKAINLNVPSWKIMMEELASNRDFYTI